jgi:uncharacterized coiled-coil DUF342 family protein
MSIELQNQIRRVIMLMKQITWHDCGRTLPEIARITGAKYSTVAAYAKKAGWTKNGKMTILSEGQVSIIVEAMKKPVSSGTKSNLLSQLEGVETTHSRALRINMLHRQIEAEMQTEIKELKVENKQLENKVETLTEELDQAKEWLSIKRVMKLNNMTSKFSWKQLKDESEEMGHEVKKTFDANYGKVNLYHINVWRSLYPHLHFSEEEIEETRERVKSDPLWRMLGAGAN